MPTPKTHRQASINLAKQSGESQMLQLTELVGQIAQKLDRYAVNLQAPSDNSDILETGVKLAEKRRAKRIRRTVANAHEHTNERSVRATSLPEPDPRVVRQIIRQRQLRARFFDETLFGDPAWDMLLELTAARAENTPISVTSLCIASGVPPTTALRWIGMLTEAGLFERIADRTDRRRTFITMTEKAINAMALYFAKLDSHAKLTT